MNATIKSTLLATLVIVAAVLAPIASSTPRRSAQQKQGSGMLRCGTVTGAHWNIRGTAGSGSHYTVTAEGVACSNARKWVPALTHQPNPGPGKAVKSPSGFTCRSIATPASGDKLVYGGVCLHPGHTFFTWTVKYK